ncbi:MAG: SDR family oxidoreductase [Rhodospirillales bacterium]|nr:SDR family oxidoreductase [Acetobacter sp.]
MARALLLDGKVAVISGGASGIGRACAFALSEEGASVVLLDSDGDTGRATLQELQGSGRKAAFFPVDVRDEEAVRDAMEQVAAQFGAIDILQCNAGVAARRTVADETAEGWDFCMDVNLKGVFLCSKHALPHMSRNGSGSIIHTSSVTGIVGLRNRAVYSATKGALVALMRNMAMDYAPLGIRVNCVCPGFVRTPLIAALLRDAERTAKLTAMHPMQRLGEPEDVAQAVLFLASPMSAWVTGQALAVDGGFSAGRPEDV